MRIENEIRFFNVKLKSEMYPVLLRKKKTEYKVSFSVWLSQGAIKKYQNSTKEMYSIIYSAERCKITYHACVK